MLFLLRYLPIGQAVPMDIDRKPPDNFDISIAFMAIDCYFRAMKMREDGFGRVSASVLFVFCGKRLHMEAGRGTDHTQRNR